MLVNCGKTCRRICLSVVCLLRLSLSFCEAIRCHQVSLGLTLSKNTPVVQAIVPPCLCLFEIMYFCTEHAEQGQGRCTGEGWGSWYGASPGPYWALWRAWNTVDAQGDLVLGMKRTRTIQKKIRKQKRWTYCWCQMVYHWWYTGHVRKTERNRGCMDVGSIHRREVLPRRGCGEADADVTGWPLIPAATVSQHFPYSVIFPPLKFTHTQRQS